jgi:Fe-S-cluster containining protein
MRWACEHLACSGCRIYDARPQGCRDFDCQWLRGEIPGDESHRPDRLGVIFDGFRDATTNEQRFLAFEVWNGAFDEPAAVTLLSELAATREIQLSYRDGSWRKMGIDAKEFPV